MPTHGAHSGGLRGRGTVSRRSALRLYRLVPALLLWSEVSAAPAVVSPGPSSSEPSESLMIGFQQGTVTMDLVDVPLADVFDELGRKTGIRFHYSSTPKGVVTASCTSMTITRALECLLGREAGLIKRYAPGALESALDALPTEVWLLGQPGSRGETNRVVRSPRTDLKQTASKNDSATEAQDEVDALKEQTKSDDPEARVQALGSVAASGKRSDRAVQETFRAALMDENGSVRAQGVYALSKGGGPEATNVLRNALHDRDASVRLMAVDTAEADVQGAALLQEALADNDETVRALAAMKLGQKGHIAGSAR